MKWINVIALMAIEAVFLCAGVSLAARNASGTMSKLYTFSAGSVISSSNMNSQFSDFETEMTDSLSRSGKGPMLAALRLTNGTNAAPSLTFDSDTDVGLYRIGADNPAMSVGGNKVEEWTANGVRVANGALATPALSFSNDTGSGLYRNAANDIRFAINGSERQAWSTTGSSVTGTLGLSDVLTQTIAGSASSNSFTSFAASLANGNNVSWFLGAAASNNSSGLVTYTKNATAANSNLCLTIYGQSSTLCVDGNNATTVGGTLKVGSGGTTTTQINFGSCTLNAGSPSTCTATVASGAKCVATNVGTSGVTTSMQVSVTTTTLTVTSSNGQNNVVNYICF